MDPCCLVLCTADPQLGQQNQQEVHRPLLESRNGASAWLAPGLCWR